MPVRTEITNNTPYRLARKILFAQGWQVRDCWGGGAHELWTHPEFPQLRIKARTYGVAPYPLINAIRWVERQRKVGKVG